MKKLLFILALFTQPALADCQHQELFRTGFDVVRSCKNSRLSLEQCQINFQNVATAQKMDWKAIDAGVKIIEKFWVIREDVFMDNLRLLCKEEGK